MGCGSSKRQPAAPAAYNPAPASRSPARPAAASTTPRTPSRDKPAEELTGLSQQQRLRRILPEDASQYGLPTVLQKNVLFKELPASVKNTHYGLDPTYDRQLKMRLLRISQVLQWDSLLVYENVPASDVVEMPYSEVTDQFDVSVLVSWRWSTATEGPKPATLTKGYAPMSAAQFQLLQLCLRKAAAHGMQYTWVDWSCVPQYSANPMPEIVRSRLYYARCTNFLIVPEIRRVADMLPVHKVLLYRVHDTLQAQAQAEVQVQAGSQPQSEVRTALAVMERILDLGLSGNEYFGRVWTLAERMARSGRSERLHHWLALEAWCGMVMHALLTTSENPKAASLYWDKLLPAAVRKRLEITTAELANTLKLGAIEVSEDLPMHIAELMVDAVRAWTTSKLEESPTLPWLKSYLEEDMLDVYQSWSTRDAIWSVYSYFSLTVRHDQEREWRSALLDLLNIAGVDDALKRFASQEASCPTMDDLVNYKRQRAGEKAATAAASADAEKARWIALLARDKRALPKAAERGDVTTVRALVDIADADVNTPGVGGENGVYLAASGGHTAVVELLLSRGGDLTSTGYGGNTALHMAGFEGHDGAAAVLLANGADARARNATGASPLHAAATNGHVAVVDVLLAHGADVKDTNDALRTPLHNAATNGHAPVVERLLAQGAHLEAKDRESYTALHWAVRGSHGTVVRMLLAAGADVHARTDEGDTALERAKAANNVAMMTLLKENGAKK